ncbi:testis-expressed protein 47 [Acanthopagrus latus]|uniref:testis-expressed protein 47 n=1 Tax=Acanthopagrus latus TaxID=8177 RepID=UPI00187C4984|nr:testis-expressed protein 47 [Acanthopagrus latus]XP_036937117.1 testis-expressed protein 47 [Acanthopagrus latus]
MAATQKVESLSSKFRELRGSEEEESKTVTMFEVLHGGTREKIVLQRLIVAAPLPKDLTDRTEIGAHYEKLNFQLSKQYMWDNMTGLLLIYPSCLLHVIESSREVLLSVLVDLKDMQQQPDRSSLEAPRVVYMAHNLQSRLFQQWSYKVLNADQGPGIAKDLLEEEESTEILVCTVLSALQKLGDQLETSKKALPGPVLDENPELIVPQKVVQKLLAQDDLNTPVQQLQMYTSPLNISMDFGQVIRSRVLTSV